jgi:diaminohydroxyphosphoribosylaminopyrimidine deaminase/5-amino-6-(5-phosphoribosylamino)uracil reductase
MKKPRSSNQKHIYKYLKLAFELAKINLGKTKTNPSVGCVIVKDNSVISSGYTSLNGRPHAEFNALKKKKLENSDIYITMEPCTHYGVTPPCTNLIKKKNIKRVYFSFNDIDKRTANKAKTILNNINIKVYKKKINDYQNFYQSYFVNRVNNTSYVDAKIAISKDFFTINKKLKWITNNLSRSRSHLLRSSYDSILSTSNSINKDNSLLNCRLNGFNNEKPDLIIIDLHLKIKKSLSLFKLSKKRKIILITLKNYNKKIIFLKKKGVKILTIKSLSTKDDFLKIFKILNKRGYSRILVEAGLKFLNTLLQNKLIYNLYVFQSSKKLGINGSNNASINILKKIKLTNKINVNLAGDSIYKIKIK